MTVSPPFLCEASKAESTPDLAVWFAVLRWFGRWTKLSDDCLGSDIVNLLRSTLGYRPKRVGTGDLVSVTVGSDDACMPTPTSHGLRVAPFGKKRTHPISCFIDGLANQCIRALLNQLASFVERLPHFWSHGSVCVWDKPCDQMGLLSRPS